MPKQVIIVTVTAVAVVLAITLAYVVGGMDTKLAALEQQASQQADRITVQEVMIADLGSQLREFPFRGTRLIRPKEELPAPLLNEKSKTYASAQPIRRVQPDWPGNYKLMRMRSLESAQDALFVMDMFSNKLVAMGFNSGKGKVEIIAGREIRNFDGFAIPPENRFAESSILSTTIHTDVGEDTLVVVHNASHMLIFYNLSLGQKKIEITGSVDLWELFHGKDKIGKGVEKSK